MAEDIDVSDLLAAAVRFRGCHCMVPGYPHICGINDGFVTVAQKHILRALIAELCKLPCYSPQSLPQCGYYNYLCPIHKRIAELEHHIKMMDQQDELADVQQYIVHSWGCTGLNVGSPANKRCDGCRAFRARDTRMRNEGAVAALELFRVKRHTCHWYNSLCDDLDAARTRLIQDKDG